jgi:hypothetical protein
MRRKPSAIDKGGISQKTWEYMRPQTRHIYNQIYPDDHKHPYGGAHFALTDIQAFVNRETAILAQFKFQRPHHICYRVVAMDGFNPNQTGLQARAQWAYPTIDSVRRHLRWKRFQSPWISLFSSWASALRRAERFAQEWGATCVYIMAIDMEPIETKCIDAHQFALAYRLDKPSLYRDEVLCFNMIPKSCLLAEIPAEKVVARTGLRPRLNVPGDLLTEAISTYSRRLSPLVEEADHIVRDCEAVRCWLFDSIWSRSISEPQAKMSRIMQSFNT